MSGHSSLSRYYSRCTVGEALGQPMDCDTDNESASVPLGLTPSCKVSHFGRLYWGGTQSRTSVLFSFQAIKARELETASIIIGRPAQGGAVSFSSTRLLLWPFPVAEDLSRALDSAGLAAGRGPIDSVLHVQVQFPKAHRIPALSFRPPLRSWSASESGLKWMHWYVVRPRPREIIVVHQIAQGREA
jgi:hypothetical protein